MSKRSPFDAVNAINKKTKLDDLSGYNPFLTNKAFAYHMDTILLAEEMNQHSDLGVDLQYDFYYYSVRKSDRYGFPPKVEDPPHLELVMNYFQYSRQKALEALQVLTLDDINDMIRSTDRGGK